MNSGTPRRSTSKTLSLVMVVGLLALVVVLDVGRRKAENEVASLTMRLDQVTGGGGAENKAAADAVIAKLKKHVKIYSDAPTVATIVKVEELQKQNPEFYKYAKNGNYVVIDAVDNQATAYLYDEQQDLVLKTVPVSFNNPPADGAAASSGAPAAPQVQANQ